MIDREFDILDISRNRQIPVAVYLPEGELLNIPVVIHSPGYGGGQQKFIKYSQGIGNWPYKDNTYLAEFFTNRGYAFISIQHDIVGDADGLETLDSNAVQAIARKHLWERGMVNIFFCIEELKKQNMSLNFEKFIISGHSNGGDISKYFANHHPELVSYVIVLDGRRCPISPNANLKLLMFEANDTTTDEGVIPGKGDPKPGERANLEWVIVKPRNALHQSYCDSGEQVDVREHTCKAIQWFLDNF